MPLLTSLLLCRCVSWDWSREIPGSHSSFGTNVLAGTSFSSACDTEAVIFQDGCGPLGQELCL